MRGDDAKGGERRVRSGEGKGGDERLRRVEQTREREEDADQWGGGDGEREGEYVDAVKTPQVSSRSPSSIEGIPARQGALGGSCLPCLARAACWQLQQPLQTCRAPPHSLPSSHPPPH
eukprot:753698-Hanusia_phi.AAC.1